MQIKDILKKWEPVRKNKKLLLLLGIGIVLLLLGSISFPKADRAEDTAEPIRYVDEKKLEKMLSEISGAGKVQLYITYGDNGEKMLAQDMTESGDDGRISKTVSPKSVSGQGGQGFYVVSQVFPRISGVLVVASGASDEGVRQRLYQSVKAALGVPLHKIHVEAGTKS